MYITDFMFDDVWLSELGYMVCSFSNSSQGEISNGSNIEFKTTPIFGGEHFLLAKSSYPEVITATLQICKKTCVSDYDPAMTVDEISKLTAWLCRKYFCDLVVNAQGYYDEDHPENTIYFVGSFTKVSRVEFGGMTIGLTLEFISDAPFAHRQLIEEQLTFTESGTQSVDINTDYIGDFYPDYIMVECSADGNLQIGFSHNSMEIANCVTNERIEINYPEIHSSIRSDAQLASNFNYEFPKLYHDESVTLSTSNEFTANMPCTIYFGYSPIVNISI